MALRIICNLINRTKQNQTSGCLDFRFRLALDADDEIEADLVLFGDLA